MLIAQKALIGAQFFTKTFKSILQKAFFINSKGREWFLKKLFATAFAADGNYEWSKINIVKMTAVGGGFL